MNKRTKELNRINNELDKQLTPENDKVLTNIICYLRVANISEYNQEVIRQDLLEMVLSAQRRGDNIQTVIGEDYKVFCDNIITSLPRQSRKEKVLNFLDTFFLCASILGVISILFSKDTFSLIRNIFSGEQLNFQLSISVGTLISNGLIIPLAFMIVHVICKSSFKPEKKRKSSMIKNFSIGAGISSMFLILAWIGRATIFTVNIFAACAVTFVVYIAHRIIARNL